MSMAELLANRFAGLVFIPKLNSHRTVAIVGRLPEDLTRLYKKNYSWNPWTQAMTRVPFGRAVSMSALVIERRFGGRRFMLMY
jgi:hypothetical protein